MKTIISVSPEQTMELAESLGRKANEGDIFALYGELGSGKTLITKGIALGLGIIEDVTSPTFTLLEIYEGRLPLYHFDLYRIESEREFDQLFFEEYWDSKGVSVIEWADRAGTRIPEERINITINYIDETTREIQIEYPSDRHINKY